MTFSFFSSVLMSFSPSENTHCMDVLRAFWATLIFPWSSIWLQVTINSIYGLDMVAKKGLWWSTPVDKSSIKLCTGRNCDSEILQFKQEEQLSYKNFFPCWTT